MNKTVKVLMIGLLPIDLSQIKGGVVAVIVNLFSGFSRLKDVQIIHVSFNEEITAIHTVEYAPNIKIHYLPYKSRFKLLDYFINRKALNKIFRIEKPDIIHIQEITPHLLRFLHWPKENIVVTQHGIMKEEIKSAVNIKDKLKSLFKGYVEKFVFPRFRNIVFISEYNKKLFPKKRIHCTNIFNPVNPMFFSRNGSFSEINSIIYVGVISKNKNLRILLQALANLKKKNILFKLWVVGGYKDPSYESEIVSFVRTNKLSSQVMFCGWLSQDQILEVYDKCRIFVLPSQQENMPVSIAEAMALGKVVVASDVGAISEMFTDKISGYLFNKDSIEELSDILKLLYLNADLIDAVSHKATLEANQKFNSVMIATRTLEFYKAVVTNLKRSSVITDSIVQGDRKGIVATKKIKVLLTGLLSVDLLSVKGGVEAVIMNLLAGFKNMESIEVHFVSFNDEISETITVQYSSNIKLYFFPYRYKIRLVDYFFNTKPFNALILSIKPDIIHIQEITPHLLRFINLPKGNIVITQHGIMKEEMKFVQGIRDKIKYLFKIYVEQYIFPLFKNIIFISKYNKKLFSGDDHKTVKIFNPVNPIFFSTSPQVINNSIIYVGVISRRKNLKLIINALARLRQEKIYFELHVVGGFIRKRYEREIGALIDQLGIQDQIIFHGWLEQKEVMEIFHKSCFFILPSQQETLPVSVAEAMALGKVVLASDVGAVSEMFTDKSSGFLFESNNTSQLCGVLKQLHGNHELIESVSKEARNEAWRKFHPDLIASKTLDFYLQMMSNNGTLPVDEK